MVHYRLGDIFRKKNNRLLLGHMGYFPDKLCRNIACWNNPQVKGKRKREGFILLILPIS